MRDIIELYQGYSKVELKEFELPAGGYSILFENVQSNGEIRLVNRARYFLSEDFVGDESMLLNSPALADVTSILSNLDASDNDK
jgi:hypothetical protein